MTTAYLNGEFLPLTEVKISAMDRGFLFGDGIYEVIPVYAGKLFRLTQHLERLRYSLNSIKLSITQTDFEIKTILEKLLIQDANEQAVYLQITRGPAATRDFYFPAQIQPTFFAYAMPVTIPNYETLATGFKVVTVPDIRWQHCDVKAITLLANVLMREQAKTLGGSEAILINGNEAVEGSSSNLFIVSAGKIITPPLNTKILGGITRDLILELAQKNQIPYEERPILKAELFSADEIWLTSSTKEIWPIINCDDQIIADGKPGKLWQQMIRLYQDYKLSLT